MRYWKSAIYNVKNKDYIYHTKHIRIKKREFYKILFRRIDSQILNKFIETEDTRINKRKNIEEFDWFLRNFRWSVIAIVIFY